jgi:hypothetical protein
MNERLLNSEESKKRSMMSNKTIAQIHLPEGE